MKLLTDDIRVFLTHGYRKIDNARVVDYLLPDKSSLGKATQVTKNVWGELGKLTGMDAGDNYAFLLAGDDHQPLMKMLTQTGDKQPKTIVEQPVGTLFAIFRYVKSGIIIDDANGQKIGYIERPVNEEDKLSQKQVSLFLIHDANGNLMGNVVAPLGGLETVPAPSAFDQVIALSNEIDDLTRVGSSSVLGPNNYPYCRVTVDRALDAQWRTLITALPLAIRFAYHQATTGLASRLPES